MLVLELWLLLVVAVKVMILQVLGFNSLVLNEFFYIYRFGVFLSFRPIFTVRYVFDFAGKPNESKLSI